MNLTRLVSLSILILGLSLMTGQVLASNAETTGGLPPNPIYITRPEVGVQLSGSWNALGGKALVPEQGSNSTTAFMLSIQYQPTFLQSLGVFAIGPTFAVYPIFGTDASPSPTSAKFSLFSVGGEFRYQARYFRKQPIVPVIGYSAEFFKYSFASGLRGQFISKGPIYGLWILLNALEPSAGVDFYIDHGVLRTYLILEARNQTGSDANIGFTGFSYYIGLRFEI